MNDTSPEAERVYWQRLSELTPAEKVGIAWNLWLTADALQRAGIRHEFPDASEEEVRYVLASRRFGEELARKMFRRE